MKSETIKMEFGKLFRIHRLKEKVAIDHLSKMIGVSTRTIMNWESGKTFIEDLSLICAIEKVMNASVPRLLEMAVKNVINRQK